MIRSAFSLAALMLLAACATQATAPPQRCDDFSGAYVLDPGACETSHGVLPVTVESAFLPDGTAIVSDRLLIGIHQDGCASLSLVTRGLDRDDPLLRRSYSVDFADPAGDTAWKDGAVVHVHNERSNLPPPIAIGAHGGWYWMLRRGSNPRNLQYESGYSESGLFFFVPYRAHARIRCTLQNTSPH